MLKNRVYRYWHYLKFGYREAAFILSLVNFLLIVGLYFVLSIPYLIALGLCSLPIMIILGWMFITRGPHMIATKAQMKFSALTQIHLHMLSVMANVMLAPTSENFKELYETNEKCKKEWLMNEY